MLSTIDVHSEIGRLKQVLVHRPGKELENLMPEALERLLFDDIPYLKIAAEEHDEFCKTLTNSGVEVVYLTNLLARVMGDENIREEFVREFVDEARIAEEIDKNRLVDYLLSMKITDMIDTMIAGIRKSDYTKRSLSDYLESDYPFIIDPMPNLYFTRDPFAAIGNGVSLHKMHSITRSRETLFAKYIFTYHPLYKDTPLWYERNYPHSIEGGDILVLNEDVVAVGISQRTHPSAVEHFASEILGKEAGFKKVIAINIPKNRSFMHLDTVFTMVDRDKFTVHPNIRGEMTQFIITNPGGNTQIHEEHLSLEDTLKKHLDLDKVDLIRCGGTSIVDAAREQWNDGSNTLAVSPGEVIVYSRNYVTNRVLEEHGIKVHEIPSCELSRGRGGPRCMSMPLIREKI
ncbi:MAG: arginine deiminase [Anaerofustis stercorihominis]|nr:arginine deiminase [Anaerofustis stercorihominis]